MFYCRKLLLASSCLHPRRATHYPRPLLLLSALVPRTRRERSFLPMSRLVIGSYYLAGEETRSKLVKTYVMSALLSDVGDTYCMLFQEYFLFRDSEILAKIKE